MNKSRLFILIIFALTISNSSYAKVDILDLKNELRKASSSDEKYKAFQNLIYRYIDVDIDSAIVYTDKAIAHFASSNDSSKIVELVYRKSTCLRLKSNCKESIELALKHIEAAKRFNNKYTESLFFSIGDSYDCLGKTDSAFFYLIKGNEYCRSLGTGICSRWLMSLADLHNSVGAYEEAYKLGLQAMDEGNFDERAQVYITQLFVVNAALGMKDPEKWLKAHQKLNDIKLEMGFDSLSVFHFNALEVSKLPPDEKEGFLKKALDYALKQGHNNSKSRIIKSLSDVYYTQGSTDKYERHFNKYFHQLSSYPSFKVEMAMNYSDLLKRKGQYKDALVWSEESIILKDSLSKVSSEKLVFELQEKYQSAEKEKKIAENKSTIQARTNQRNIFLSLGLILGLLSLLGFSRFRSKQKLDASKILYLEKEKKILSMNAMMEGQEAERMRIAKDLHDGLGGLLSSVKARLSKIMTEVKKIESFDLYAKTTDMVDEACHEVRRISHNLIPGSLRLSGLKVAVEQLGEELTESHSFAVNTEVIGYEDEINETTEVFIFRIIQESINNIIKHADAKKVLIQLTETDDEYHITIEDDGKGFDTTADYEGIGLKSIRSRAEYLKGEMDLVSNLGVGSTLSVHIPKSSDE